MLTITDTQELTELRRTLHQHPELSGDEFETAKTIVASLEAWNPSEIYTCVGGHGRP